MKYRIDLDNRVGSIDLLDELRRQSGSDVQSTRLDSGDVAFAGNGPESIVRIGIERKRIYDYIESMTTGRLALSQLDRMNKQYKAVYVIIEGMYRLGHANSLEIASSSNQWIKHPDASMTYTRFAGSVTSLVNHNVRVLYTTTPIETCAMIVRIWEWWQEPWEKHASADIYIPHFAKTGVRIEGVGFILFDSLPATTQALWRSLATFPNIGKKAGALAYRFKTFPGIMQATPKQLAEFVGKGETLAYVWAALHNAPVDKEMLK